MDSRLKRRYNLCARLRRKGVVITTDAHAIEVTHQQYEALGTIARRYCEALQNEYYFVVQLKIPEVPLLPERNTIKRNKRYAEMMRRKHF